MTGKKMSSIPQEVIDSIILDAQRGLSADEITDKLWSQYQIPYKRIQQIGKGFFTKDSSKKGKKTRRRTKKREYNLLDALGMDYVQYKKRGF